MEKSIVIFGPGHVGKSTLAGYLIYKRTSDFDIDKFKSQVEKSVGEYYDESQLFAYIVDTSPRERMDAERKVGGQEGTSKFLHIDRVNIEGHGLTVLDTPGAQHHYKERIRGWFYGNIGVFVIELSKLVKHKQLKFNDLKRIQEYLTTLHLWLEYKADNDILIVLSKMDELNFSEDNFNNICKMINNFFGDKKLDIIPISIDVKNRIDHNVLTRSDKFSWYSGPTFLEKISELIRKTTTDLANKPLLMYVDREFKNIDGLGKVWRAKIIQGTLNKDTALKFAPVIYETKKDMIVYSKLRNIRLEKGGDVDSAETGSIVGLDLRDIRIKGKRIERKSFEIEDTTLITEENVPLIKGGILKFKISSEDLKSLNLLQEISILWFGRFIFGIIIDRIIDKEIGEDYGSITVELKNLFTALPLENNEFLMKDFMIQMAEDYYHGELIEMGSIKTVDIEIKNIEENESAINRIFKKFYFMIMKNKIHFENFDSISQILRNLKRLTELEEFKEDIISKVIYDIIEIKE